MCDSVSALFKGLHPSLLEMLPLCKLKSITHAIYIIKVKIVISKIFKVTVECHKCNSVKKKDYRSMTQWVTSAKCEGPHVHFAQDPFCSYFDECQKNLIHLIFNYFLV